MTNFVYSLIFLLLTRIPLIFTVKTQISLFQGIIQVDFHRHTDAGFMSHGKLFLLHPHKEVHTNELIQRFDSIPLMQDNFNVKSNADTFNMLLLTCQPLREQIHSSYVKYIRINLKLKHMTLKSTGIKFHFIYGQFEKKGKVKKEKIFKTISCAKL